MFENIVSQETKNTNVIWQHRIIPLGVAKAGCGRKLCLTHVSGSSRVMHVNKSRGKRKIKGPKERRFVTNRSAYVSFGNRHTLPNDITYFQGPCGNNGIAHKSKRIVTNR